MNKFLADLHIHSRYARACSPQLTVENIELWCRIKGLRLVATGDFTYPKWRDDLHEKLEPVGNGLYRLKKEFRVSDPRFKEVDQAEVNFICGTEIACIYSNGGQVRRIHHLIFAPSLEVVDKIVELMDQRGCKLKSDGRPIVGMSSRDLLQLILKADERCKLIPAHAWTPWFAIFGSKSGYDSIEECFGDMSDQIFAIEMGLSSDPAMNWRVKALDKVGLTASSDAHSLPNLGREAVEFTGDELSYDQIFKAIKLSSIEARVKGLRSTFQVSQTIGFFPDEGRYHYDGHREHKVSLHPAETRKYKGICPKCHRPLVIGVLNRVEELATEPEGRIPEQAVPFTSLVELDKVIAQSLGVKGRATKAVEAEYWSLVSKGGGELSVLLQTTEDELNKMTSPVIVEGIMRLRRKQVEIIPGYDGEYGRINIFTDKERKKYSQGSLF
ncbi:MAG: endonuclease Q family protein [bacterium]